MPKPRAKSGSRSVLHPLDIQSQGELRAVPHDDREEQQDRGPEADIKQVRRPTTQDEREQDPDDHARDQHGVVLRVASALARARSRRGTYGTRPTLAAAPGRGNAGE